MKSYATAIDNLQKRVEEFRVESERFLSGAIIRPPDEIADRIRRSIRNLYTENIQSAVEQFRLSALEARFNTLSEFYNRRQREQEESTSSRRSSGAIEISKLDARRGVRLQAGTEEGKIRVLHTALSRQGAMELDLPAFQRYLDNQIRKIQSKTGCSEVSFRVAEENGKIKLKARPVKD